MSILKPETVEKIQTKHHKLTGIKPEIFLETGTYLAKSIRAVYHLFREAYTIELANELYRDAINKYAHLGIHFHHGDSKIMLREIAEGFHEPVFFYLDAHAFGRKEVAIDSPFPLWDEIEYISSRGLADVVLVDDVHAWGCPAELGTTGEEFLDWESVTKKRVLKSLGGIAAGSYILDDAFVIHLGAK